jgi:hypothetical protein
MLQELASLAQRFSARSSAIDSRVGEAYSFLSNV